MTRKNISVAEAAEHWQRCRQEDLPRVFYAYDEDEQQSERVVTYRLGEEGVQQLIEQIDGSKDFKFVVHLGLYPQDLSAPLTNDPAFALYLQVYRKDADRREDGLELAWARNSRFSSFMETDVNSGINAIPAASAYLFVHSWLEMAESALDRPFTAATRVMGQRVKAFIFSAEESQSIYQDILNSPKKQLDVHLGNGLAVWEHPFSFRPVVEVAGAVVKGGTRTTPMNATGLTDNDGNSYYDFSMPEPPGRP